MKKLLSLLLCTLMIMSATVSAYAEYVGYDEENTDFMEIFSLDFTPDSVGDDYSLGVVSVDNSKISFVISYLYGDGIKIYDSGLVTADLNGNSADFDWTDNFGNSGNGSVTFNQNSVTVKMVRVSMGDYGNPGCLATEFFQNTQYYDKSSGTITLYSEDNSGTTYNKIMSQGTKSVATSSNTIKIPVGSDIAYKNDEPVEVASPAYVQPSSNSVMVPLRFVAVATGMDADSSDNKIMWDDNSKTATILYAAVGGQKIIQFTVDSDKMVVDGVTIPINNGATAEIKEGRMYVPFRALGEAMGVAVSWDNSTRTAIFNN